MLKLLMKRAFKKINVPSGKYSTHSFRKGAAHEASLAGIQDSKIKAMTMVIKLLHNLYFNNND